MLELLRHTPTKMYFSISLLGISFIFASYVLAAAPLNYSPASSYATFSGEQNNPSQSTWGAARNPFRRPFPVATPWTSAQFCNMTIMNPFFLITRAVFYRNAIGYQNLGPMYTAPVSKNRTALYHAVGNFLARDISFIEKPSSSRSSTATAIYYSFSPYAANNIPEHASVFLNTGIILPNHATYKNNSYTNLQSSYIDLSNVYGTSKFDADSIRTFSGGELLLSGKSVLKAYWNDTSTSSYLHDYVTNFSGTVSHCVPYAKCEYDYVTPAMVTLFSLAHNARAKKLAAANPTWSDEVLYNEARRWMIAVWQKIVYYDFLPLFLDLPKMPSYNKYDSNLQADIDLLFGTVTMRQLRTEYPQNPITVDFSPNYGLIENPVTYPFQEVTVLHESGGHAIFRGLVSTPAGERDTLASPKLIHRYINFTAPNCNYRDFLSLDHLRAHRCYMPTYDEFREIYGLTKTGAKYPYANYPEYFVLPAAKATDWIMYQISTAISMNLLDVVLGMRIEQPIPGRNVGPLFEKSALDQFDRLRHGDRYYFENPLSPAPFTSEQIDEIKSITIEQLIFDNFPVGRFPRNGLSSIYSYIDGSSRPDDYIDSAKCL